jgi:hypothetical protein
MRIAALAFIIHLYGLKDSNGDFAVIYNHCQRLDMPSKRAVKKLLKDYDVIKLVEAFNNSY